MRSWIALSLLASIGAACPSLALAQEAPAKPAPPPDPVDVRAEWTQFVGAAVAGEGDSSPRYGGRVDAYLRADGEQLGLWDGLTLNLQAEYVYGKNINRVGSSLLLPVNTALAFPKNDGAAFDLSYNIVQKLGKFRVQAGKINLLDASSATPIVSGGGKEGFQHIGLASPPGLLASPKVFGAIVSAPVGKLILNLGVWTPDDWTRQYEPGGIFEDGANGLVAAVLPTKIGGLRGFHTFSVFLTSRRVNGAEDYPDIRPPPGTGRLLPSDPGGTHLRYAVQQYLWQDPTDPKRGWGLFGHVALSTGAPGILDWSMTAGVAGSVPIASRPLDRFGLGYFRFSLANRVVDGLASALPLRDEQGAELYYTAQLWRHLRLTAATQLVDPVIRRADPAVNLSLRLKADF